MERQLKNILTVICFISIVSLPVIWHEFNQCINDKDIVTKTSIVGLAEIENALTEELQENTEQTYKTEIENTIEIKEAETKVELNIDNTKWTNEKQNEVNFEILLDTSSPANNLFNNPTIKIKMPNDIDKIILKA